jgi:hypothetical protein
MASPHSSGSSRHAAFDGYLQPITISPMATAPTRTDARSSAGSGA